MKCTKGVEFLAINRGFMHPKEGDCVSTRATNVQSFLAKPADERYLIVNVAKRRNNAPGGLWVLPWAVVGEYRKASPIKNDLRIGMADDDVARMQADDRIAKL